MVGALFPIVEGHGEREAVPVLLRRFAHEVYGQYEVRILQPFRLPRGKFGIPGELSRVVEFAGRKLSAQEGEGAIIIVVDADDDCPAETAPRILADISHVWPAINRSVVMPMRELEAWFLAAAISLRGTRRIKADALPPENPESIRGAKEYLERELMEPGAVYSPTVDQPSLASAFSFAEARTCGSFDKLWRDLDRIFA